MEQDDEITPDNFSFPHLEIFVISRANIHARLVRDEFDIEVSECCMETGRRLILELERQWCETRFGYIIPASELTAINDDGLDTIHVRTGMQFAIKVYNKMLLQRLEGFCRRFLI